MKVEEIVQMPLFGVALSVICYAVALVLQKIWSWLHPLFVSATVIIVFLLLTHIPYEAYAIGGDILVFLLGPATVALGIPLYKNANRIRSNAASILGGITVGTLSAVLLSAALVWCLGGNLQMMLTMMPKSVTSPVSLEISRQAGGIPELTVVLTVLTGLIGSMIGPELLRWAGVRDDVAIGTAIGTASHGIGTARVIRESELQGGISGFSMGIAAILTSILFIPLYGILHP